MFGKKLSIVISGSALSCVLALAGTGLSTPAAYAATLHSDHNTSHAHIVAKEVNAPNVPGFSFAFGSGTSYAGPAGTFATSTGGALAVGNNTQAYGNTQGVSNWSPNSSASDYYSGWYASSH